MSSCAVIEDLLAAPSCLRCCPCCACCPALSGVAAAAAPSGPATAPIPAPAPAAIPTTIPAIPAAVAAWALPDCDVACKSAVAFDVPVKLAGRAASTRRICSAISWGTETSSQREGLEGTEFKSVRESRRCRRVWTQWLKGHVRGKSGSQHKAHLLCHLVGDGLQQPAGEAGGHRGNKRK